MFVPTMQKVITTMLEENKATQQSFLDKIVEFDGEIVSLNKSMHALQNQFTLKEQNTVKSLAIGEYTAEILERI